MRILKQVRSDVLLRYPAWQGSSRGLDPGALLARVINSLPVNPPPVQQSTLLASF